MKAVVVDHFMPPSELRVGEAPEPEVGAGMVLVAIQAAGCNFFDTLIVQGKYQMKPAFPFIPGGELAGIVRAVGGGVTGRKPGDRVLASLSVGAYAERIAAPAQATFVIPDSMSFEQAASFPVVYPTAHAALVHRGMLRAGETVLVTAAAGGVGIATIQIAKALGARVIAAAGGAEKLAIAREQGADVVVDYTDADWPERVKEATSGRGADVIVENVGGDVFDGCTRCIAWAGRIVVLGFASGKLPELAVNRVMLKNIAVIGLHWGPHFMHERETVDRTFAALFDLFETGAIRPVVWKTFPLARIADALDALGSRKSYGKIVVVP